MKLEIEERHLAIVTAILKKYNHSFFVFGSRVNGNSKKFSDLDLLYFDDIPQVTLLQLEEDFEESDLPYTVDLLNYTACDESFKKCIGNKFLQLQKI